jgi:hypothetical protein
LSIGIVADHPAALVKVLTDDGIESRVERSIVGISLWWESDVVDPTYRATFRTDEETCVREKLLTFLNESKTIADYGLITNER